MNITDPIFHDEAKAVRHIFLSRAGLTASRSARIAAAPTPCRWVARRRPVTGLCRDCRDKFTVRTGTVMERCHIPLHKWLLATHLIAASKKGMSALQLSRMLGVTYKTAWFLSHRIREAMDEANGYRPAWWCRQGCRERRSLRRRLQEEAPVSGKVAPKKKVMTLVERDGRARSFHVTEHRSHEHSRRAGHQRRIARSTLMTDDARWYVNVGREFAKHGSTLHATASSAVAMVTTPTRPRTSSPSSSAA